MGKEMICVMYQGKKYSLYSCLYGSGQAMAILIGEDGGFIARPISAIKVESDESEVNKPVHKKRGRPSGGSDGV